MDKKSKRILRKQIIKSFLALFFLSIKPLWAEEKLDYLGIKIDLPVKAMEQDRYQSLLSYEESKKILSERLRHINFIASGELNLPQLRTTSFKNNNQNSSLSYINISFNTLTGLTNIFFVHKQ